MAKSIPVDGKKRGRPAGSLFADPQPVRLTAEQLARVDAWRASQNDAPSRSEAIRRLIDTGLGRFGGLEPAPADMKTLVKESVERSVLPTHRAVQTKKPRKSSST